VNSSSFAFPLLSYGTTVESSSKRPSLDQDETKTEKINSFSLSLNDEMMMIKTFPDSLPRYVGIHDGPQLAHY
jgi:hypothetical protein